MKKFATVMVVLCLVVVGSMMMANAGDKAKDTAKAIVEYPAKLVQKSVEAVSDTAKTGTETVVNQAEATGGMLTGDGEKAKEFVTNPVTGTAETAKTAVEGVVTAPVEAAK